MPKIENATILQELRFIKSVTHSFAFLLWNYVASNDKLTGVCIALKSFADDSSADWSGNSVNCLTLISNMHLLMGHTSKRNLRIE